MGGVIIGVAVEYTSSEVLLASAGHGRQNPGSRMTLFTAPRADQASIETRYSWVVATVALITLAFSFGGLWIVAVGLKAVAAPSARQTASSRRSASHRPSPNTPYVGPHGGDANAPGPQGG